MTKLECGRTGYLAYAARDIGYGVESDEGEFIYCGPAHGKLMFAPLDERPSVYLFQDEIESWTPYVCTVCGDPLYLGERERVRSDVDFVEHGNPSHLIRLEGVGSYA